MSSEIAAAARAFVLNVPSLSGEGVAQLLGQGAQPKNIGRMRDQGTLVGHRVGQRGWLHPAFQIEASRHRVDPVVAEINRTLRSLLGPSDALLWWRDPVDNTQRPRWQSLGQREGLDSDLATLLGGTASRRRSHLYVPIPVG